MPSTPSPDPKVWAPCYSFTALYQAQPVQRQAPPRSSECRPSNNRCAKLENNRKTPGSHTPSVTHTPQKAKRSRINLGNYPLAPRSCYTVYTRNFGRVLIGSLESKARPIHPNALRKKDIKVDSREAIGNAPHQQRTNSKARIKPTAGIQPLKFTPRYQRHDRRRKPQEDDRKVRQN